MKNIIKNTRDINRGENKIFLRIPMGVMRQEKMKEILKYRENILKARRNGNIPATLNLILLNQMMIWQKLQNK